MLIVVLSIERFWASNHAFLPQSHQQQSLSEGFPRFSLPKGELSSAHGGWERKPMIHGFASSL
jgi:hypothetical protein